MQWSLRMVAKKLGIDLGAVRDQCGHNCFTVRKMARPVSGYVEQRALSVVLAVARPRFSLRSCSNNARLPPWIA